MRKHEYEFMNRFNRSVVMFAHFRGIRRYSLALLSSLRAFRMVALLLPGMIAGRPLIAQPMRAPTPPMGWNSWDAYGTTVT
jgi:hypothetical protein